MGVTVSAPQNSFVQFESMDTQHCIYGVVKSALPVYAEDDVAFQFFIDADTTGEAAALAQPGDTSVTVGLTDEDGNDLVTFSDKPTRYKLDSLSLVYLWPFGLPDFDDYVLVGQCFKIKVAVGATEYLSNRFKRINAYEACVTSVIEYGSDDNGFGFNYCASAPFVDNGNGGNGGGTGGGGSTGGGTGNNGEGESQICMPTRITFTDFTSIRIPYTAQLSDMYGALPTVQIWIYENGELVKANVEAKLDGYPPSEISINFGGVASGIIIIK